MSIVNLSKNQLAKTIVLYAINDEVRNNLDKIEVIESENGDLLKDIKLIVGGVELDFERVVKRIGEQFDNAIENRAVDIINEKFQSLSSELDDLQERVTENKERFKYNWEE